MCLGVPGRIESCHDDRGTAMGVVRFGGSEGTGVEDGIVKTICLALTPQAVVGDWVIVHAGVAISVLDETAAAETLELFARMLPEG